MNVVNSRISQRKATERFIISPVIMIIVVLMSDTYEVKPLNKNIPEKPPDVNFKWIGKNFGKALPTLLNPPKLIKMTNDDVWGPHAHLALILEGVVLVGIIVGALTMLVD